ncbi:MAG TPA: enoyl-CoA hydratase/isomerase family protein [Solirubrobacteraceae bacterium]|nr:enoyl-CoA hydratase/isomerase family protein [Solirubrobacteraceae bacterium]
MVSLPSLQSSFDALLVQTVDGITTITFNRPDRLNALDETARTEFLAVLRAVDEDVATRVVILTGAGRAFCAGGDIKAMSSEHSASRLAHEARPVYSTGRHIIQAILAIEKPIIAKVNGPAMGLGATLALFCDLVLMGEDASIADTHVKVGLTAGDGGAVIWPLLIGPMRAKELLLTGRAVKGVEAAEIGLVNSAHPADELDAAVLALAETLRDLPAYAVRSTKASVNRMVGQAAHNTLDASLSWEHLSMSDYEHHAAIERFAVRRSGS